MSNIIFSDIIRADHFMVSPFHLFLSVNLPEGVRDLVLLYICPIIAFIRILGLFLD